jgi:hypothetical protein
MSVLAAMLLASPAFAADKAKLEEVMSHDGLQKIKVKGIDLAYARPGATLAGYDKVKLDPVEVAFRKDWDPTRPGSMKKLTTEERENIRSGVSKVVYDSFAAELQKGGGYRVVNEAGPDVLRVKAQIVNLYVNAPDTRSGASTRVYVVSAGEMTLAMELYDSETGQVLARVVDRREARSAGQLTISNSVINASEAEAIAANWARVLRNGLDKAHGIGKK